MGTVQTKLLDTVYSVETPEGVQLPLKPAGVGPRILAYLVDLLLRTGAYIIISIVLSIFGQSGFGILLIMFFLIEWWYPVFFELFYDGATPGKKSIGLRVVHDDGTPITLAGSLLRNLLRVVDFLPFYYVTGIVTSALNSSGKRIGDLVAGTIVTYVHKSKNRDPIGVDGIVAPIPQLKPHEQNAIISFAERSSLLSKERSLELASILMPLLEKYDGMPDDILKKMAKGLIGQQ